MAALEPRAAQSWLRPTLTSKLTFLALPKLTIDVDLEKVSREDVCSFRVGSGNFVQRTSLTDGEDVVDLADPHLMPRPDDEKVSRGGAMMIQRGAEQTVFKCCGIGNNLHIVVSDEL